MGVAQYTGHGAKTGGLQQHSIGDLYPFTIEAFGNLRPVRWRWRNLVTGQVGKGQPTHNLAMIDLTSLRINTPHELVRRTQCTVPHSANMATVICK